MRLIAARLALEAPTVFAVLIIVAAHKAFMAGPRLNQRAIHTEVLAREPLLVLGDAHNLVKESALQKFVRPRLAWRCS